MTTRMNLDLLNKARLRALETDSNVDSLTPSDNASPSHPEGLASPADTIDEIDRKTAIEIRKRQADAKIKKEVIRLNNEIEAEEMTLLEKRREDKSTQDTKIQEENKKIEDFKIEKIKKETETVKKQAVYEQEIAEAKKIEAQTKSEEAELLRQIAQKESDTSLANKKQFQQLEDQRHDAIKERVWKWLKMLFITLFILIVIGFLLISLYRFYRWAVEEPLTIEVDKIVEVEKLVPVEKIVEVEKIVIRESEVAEIAPNCMKFIQDNKTNFNCAGTTYQVNTLSELNAEQIAQIKSSMEKRNN